jgi:Zn-dependent M16 (insulinase) family peptidase
MRAIVTLALLGGVPGVLVDADGRVPERAFALKEGDVRHGFTVRAAYLGLSESPIGLRLVHRTGLPLALFFFDAAPQVSIQVRTLPVSNMGEPHTLEHLAVGKGRMGKLLGTLQVMRNVTASAGTYQDVTMYQFRTPIGAAGFYEMLTHYIETLARPDFTDEEARREVANLEVVEGPGGRLTLVEKGTIYNEQVAGASSPRRARWLQLLKMAFGEDHPLARFAGGEPAAVRELGPEAIRRFHAQNYRIGPNIEMVVSLPPKWSSDEFLQRMDALFTRLSADGGAPTPATMPPFVPAPAGEVRIGSYPAASADAPQEVLLGWPALPELTPDDHDGLKLLLEIVADGEASYLYGDLIEPKTRVFDSRATAVDSGIFEITARVPYVYFSGLPASSVEQPHLERIRAAVVQRCAWISGLPEGSKELSEVAAKGKVRLAAARRRYLKLLDGSPGFGDRSDRSWHDRLALLARAPGFTKPLAPFSYYERLEGELAGGANPWRSLLARARLTETPYLSAVKPDPGLAERARAETAERLARHERAIADRLGGGDAAKGLAALRAEYDARTRELDERDRAVRKPEFVSDPPLTLDDAPFEQTRLAGTVPLVRVHFETTPFTDVAVAFDLSRVPDEDLPLLPLLGALLSDSGVTTRGGERLDYVRAQERRESELYDFAVGPLTNPATSRYELEVRASASSGEEIPRALEWMENHLLRPGGPALRARLVDLCKKAIQADRTAFNGAEYDWAEGLAATYRYRDNPLHLAVSSVFTRLRWLTRLRWRIEDPTPETRQALRAELAAVDERLAAKAERAAVAARLESLEGELGETLRYELSLLPDDRWREDLGEVVTDLRAAIAADAAPVLDDLERLRRRVLVRRGARARITGSSAHATAAAKLLGELLTRLPEGEVAAAPVRRGTSWVHARLEQRYGRLTPPRYVAFVRPESTTAVHANTAAGPTYASRARQDAIDALAASVFGGLGPHSFYKRTWSAGLAYSNGLGLSLSAGRILYYADRCPDPVRVMKFVVDAAKAQRLDDPFLLQYALAGRFTDFRSASTFSRRGEAMAADLADGITPETVARFKRLLLETAREKDALARMMARVPDVIGRVLVGYGPTLAETPEALGFIIGPEDLIAKYEAFLKEQGECERLIRLYPRDFWPLPGP